MGYSKISAVLCMYPRENRYMGEEIDGRRDISWELSHLKCVFLSFVFLSKCVYFLSTKSFTRMTLVGSGQP